MTTLVSEHDVATGCEGASGGRPNERFDRASTDVTVLMQLLPESQQEALRLKFQAGLSYAEIARVMEITVNHVGVLIHTALKTIREQMKTSEMNVSLPGER